MTRECVHVCVRVYVCVCSTLQKKGLYGMEKKYIRAEKIKQNE